MAQQPHSLFHQFQTTMDPVLRLLSSKLSTAFNSSSRFQDLCRASCRGIPFAQQFQTLPPSLACPRGPGGQHTAQPIWGGALDSAWLAGVIWLNSLWVHGSHFSSLKWVNVDILLGYWPHWWNTYVLGYVLKRISCRMTQLSLATGHGAPPPPWCWAFLTFLLVWCRLLAPLQGLDACLHPGWENINNRKTLNQQLLHPSTPSKTQALGLPATTPRRTEFGTPLAAAPAGPPARPS